MVTFKADKSGIIHAPVGKISLGFAKLKQNISFFYHALLGAKPDKHKGEFIVRAFISSSQGPSLKLDLNSFLV